MAYGDFKDWPRRTERLASMIYRFLDKNTAGGTVKNQMVQKNELAEELNKPINRKFKEWKVH